VVLFTLLLGGGLGSFSTTVARNFNPQKCLYALLILLVLFGVLTHAMTTALSGASVSIRIAATIAIMLPLGFFMGMCFPLGMRIADQQAHTLTAWLWGVNGATSVCASVLAIAVAINFGISASFWSGTICYCLAVAAFLSTAGSGNR
jgi:hypothetical protein